MAPIKMKIDQDTKQIFCKGNKKNKKDLSVFMWNKNGVRHHHSKQVEFNREAH